MGRLVSLWIEAAGKIRHFTSYAPTFNTTLLPCRNSQCGFFDSRAGDNKKATARVAVLLVMVEAAGIEPASANPLPLALHAYPRQLI